MVALSLASIVVAASVVLAAPSIKTSGCDISKAKISIPSGQTALVQPTLAPSYVSVAIGVQNYTCTDAGTYTSAGAVAELFDISCLVGKSTFNRIQDDVFTVWKLLPKQLTAAKVVELLHFAKTPTILGQHYFIINPLTGVGISPKWDFTSQGATKGNPNAFVVGARTGGLAAPTGPQDVDWLSLSNAQGQLADQIYRVDTRGGQPPASCTPGSAPISVKYASKYWLFGGSVHH
ncbi:hypothetical protein PLEOSDRAFT_1100408 [Pleurotus ostreatus PC15]|uniref:Malate dehydrogenase n=1 Tax=Pleurotus ostreatus (strain PC15) TaxID=1137138 RepID=A0A067NUZ5_PLEO1|nr:hypothetical protein PLEOSDRAFT_1100408 [Pleurotus ostreatus PC15]